MKKLAILVMIMFLFNSAFFAVDVVAEMLEKSDAIEPISVSYEPPKAESIALSGDEERVITKSGAYVFSGEYTGNAICVEVDGSDDGIVYLLLNEVNITSENAVPISVNKAEKVIVVLSGKNSIRQTVNSDEKKKIPKGAVYSQENMVFLGDGSLNIETNYENGINCKGDLVIGGGTFAINAVKNGIVGSGYLQISGANITMDVGNDALKTTKKDAELLIVNGEFVIEAKGEALHAEKILQIDGGVFDIYAEKNAIQAKNTVLINGGTINITDCEEGVEGRYVIINGGNINIDSRDDSLNVSEVEGGIEIHGGEIVINFGLGGDGIDSNGYYTQTGGNIKVLTADTKNLKDGAFDADGKVTITGGTLLYANGEPVKAFEKKN